ncbi:MucB/RseB C-terminal domain-containing protein [Marinobacter sp. F3R11]|uniref:MucB/RseB C-terminal domain-containing protein n=1 Tax=Marinobacter sp. F3R11 TaxID=2267231 RepID=UPI003965D67D
MSKVRYFGLSPVDLSLRWLLALLLLMVMSASAVAGDKSAVYWLERLGPALNMTSYRGVFVYARGSSVHSMQIAHRYHNGIVEERLVLQDGGSGEIVRRGMNVVCVLPEQGRVKLDQIIPSGPFAEAFTSQLTPLSRWYSAELKGEDRIAGYDVVAVALTAKDQNRYSHRLWLEKSTGLLVKSHVRSSGGEVLEHFQFTSLEITDDIADSEFEVRTEGREISRTLNESGQYSDSQDKYRKTPRMQGWSLTWRPEGFEPAAAPVSGRGQAVAFSDGLAAFSVFVESAGRVNMPTGASRVGATTIYMRNLHSENRVFRVTVVGEIPPVTARQVADSVQVGKAFALGAGDL